MRIYATIHYFKNFGNEENPDIRVLRKICNSKKEYEKEIKNIGNNNIYSIKLED